MNPNSKLQVQVLAILARVRHWPRWALWSLGFSLIAVVWLLAALGGTGREATSINPLWVALDLIIKLILVLGLIYGSLYLLRRWQGNTLARPDKQVRLLESTRLSPRQGLHLVQAGTRVLLIGATDNSLSTLAEIDQSELSDPQLISAEPFSESLAKAIKSGDGAA
ncbi:MAG: flagellar biosynthetic protein FliO [Chloroflexi bacterium]|nr:MAG: flagellar biosynthetic protein FliO [Chloroflexota bacterium]MBL1194812.1 flagellar biosynthetic protein FliO [Chloroflexota bacterium]NOH12103.1 flagellar biosynthetic protein FliO [Chloroflexota bacterium]